MKKGAEIHSDLLEITSEPEIVNLLKKTLDKNEKIKREKEFPILAEIKKQKEILKQKLKKNLIMIMLKLLISLKQNERWLRKIIIFNFVKLMVL